MGDDRYFHDIADPVHRRAALLDSAANTLQGLLTEIGPVSGSAALSAPPLTYSTSVELALHQLRRQIVLAGRPDWVRQLNELSYASCALWRASELAQQSVTGGISERRDQRPAGGQR